MSAETGTNSRKKKVATDLNPAPEADHRKRRRNRTTQSCLNCHTSKRMCDRKRPACARCTQLGLTGLCVYEVDDPSQRLEAQDESSRLLKRVAELEGVIRELKNKPHPRWVQSTTSVEEFDKWSGRLQSGTDDSGASSVSSPPISCSSSERGEPSSSSFAGYPPSMFPMPHPQLGLDVGRKSSFSAQSPMTTPSPALLTPTDEYPISHIGVAGHPSLSLASDYDLATMFLSYPGLVNCGDSHLISPTHTRAYGKEPDHCGCLQDTTSYNALLELSLRLRKASEILSRSTSHQTGNSCHLHLRVSELDRYATNALSEMISGPVDIQDHEFHPSHMYHTRPPNSSRVATRPWEMIASTANSPAPDDSFMTWDPPRRL